jgi:GNAT superfamily N-acetyltransferase
MLEVSPASPEDISELVRIFFEMDEFYGESSTESGAEKERNIRSALFGSRPFAYALAARRESSVVGVACYSFLWPAILSSRSLYLKELYVAKDARRTGVGSALMDALIDIARLNNCRRVEWTTDRDNQEAQDFYSRMNVRPLPSKIFYRTDVLNR